MRSQAPTKHSSLGGHSAHQRSRVLCSYAAAFFLFVFSGITISAQEQITMPDGIVLLRSTRADLEKIAAPFSTSPGESRYTLNGSKLYAYFADERCAWHGWDVPPGTLIALTVHAQTETKADVEKFRAEGFEHNIDDAFFEQYWSNQKGLRYVIDSWGTLRSVTFFPAGTDLERRCPGFPPFDISTSTYSIYFEEKLSSFRNPDFFSLPDFLMRLRNRVDLKGYLFVYHKRGGSTEAERFAAAVRKLIAKRDVNTAARIEIRVGGIRDENELVGYLLFATQTPPKPYPKFADPLMSALEKPK